MNIKKTDAIYFTAVLCALLLLMHANAKLPAISELVIYILINSACVFLSFLSARTSSVEVKKAFTFPPHSALLCSTVYTSMTAMNICASLLFPNAQLNIDFSLYTLVFSGIVVPFFEEVFWRGCLCRCLKPLGTLPAMIIPAIMFGLLHRGTAGLIAATFSGLMFAYLYILTDSIIPSIIIHILNNTAGVLSVKYPIFALILIFLSFIVFIVSNLHYKIKNIEKPKFNFSFEYTTLKSPYLYLCLFLFVFIRIAGGLQ